MFYGISPADSTIRVEKRERVIDSRKIRSEKAVSFIKIVKALHIKQKNLTKNADTYLTVTRPMTRKRRLRDNGIN